MTREEFVQRFTDAVDFSVPGELSADTVITSLDEWDSLAQLGVIVMFDTQFKKTITADMIACCRTIGDLYHLSKA